MCHQSRHGQVLPHRGLYLPGVSDAPGRRDRAVVYLSFPLGMITCRKCGDEKDDNEFEINRGTARRRTCRSCRSVMQTSRPSYKAYNEDPDVKAKIQAYRKTKRAENPDYAIFRDTLNSDRKNGLGDHDLTRELILSLIVNGCQYCGETKLRMTLDRKNNMLGHNKDNVIPACIRCNYMRGSMPLEAWLELLPGVRAAREKGLFGDWRSVPLTKTKKSI